MVLAVVQARALAINLSGIGQSTWDQTNGSKHQLATVVHELVTALGPEDLTLVSADAGGIRPFPGGELVGRWAVAAARGANS